MVVFKRFVRFMLHVKNKFNFCVTFFSSVLSVLVLGQINTDAISFHWDSVSENKADILMA